MPHTPFLAQQGSIGGGLMPDGHELVEPSHQLLPPTPGQAGSSRRKGGFFSSPCLFSSFVGFLLFSSSVRRVFLTKMSGSAPYPCLSFLPSSPSLAPHQASGLSVKYKGAPVRADSILQDLGFLGNPARTPSEACADFATIPSLYQECLLLQSSNQV